MKSAWLLVLLSLIIGFSLGIAFDKFSSSRNAGKCTSCASFKKDCKAGCCKDNSCYKFKCGGHCKSKGKCHGCKGKEKMLAHFSSELNLTNDQKTKVAAIFESKHKEMIKIREELHPKFEALRKSTHDEINKILTIEQKAKFEKLDAKFKSFRKKHHGPED